MEGYRNDWGKYAYSSQLTFVLFKVSQVFGPVVTCILVVNDPTDIAELVVKERDLVDVVECLV